MPTLEMTKQVLRPHRLDENGNEKSIIWMDILNFCKTLTLEELHQDVRVWGDEKGGGIYAISVIQDDLINPSGEGVEMKSMYINDSEDEESREMAEDEPVVMPKGTIIFELDF